MMRIALLVAVSAGLLGVSGCSKNVLLGEAVSVAPSPREEPQVLRLYYDRDGDLYPGHLLSVPTPHEAFTNIRHNFQLHTHFVETVGRGDPRFWGPVLDSLKLAYSADHTTWLALQDSLINRAVARLQELTRPSRDSVRTLVVLVHGFNNDAREAEASYREVRRRLEDEFVDPRRTVYLKVFWDGLTNDLGIPIWSKAQFNFPLVGLAFRRVLNRVPVDVPVRILTHSSGGPLIANTLWNAIGSLQPYGDPDTWPRYMHYRKHTADTEGLWAPPRHRDLRVGMIVPAMPGQTFASVAPDQPGPARVVIGVNPYDLAITKFGIVPVSVKVWQPPCVHGGSTCLAARPADYCEGTRNTLGRVPGTTVRVVDFSRPRRTARDARSAYLLDRHDVEAYLGRPQMKRFLSLVFGDSIEDEGDEASWCSAFPQEM